MSIEKQDLVEKNISEAFDDRSFKEILSPEDFENYIASRENVSFKKGQFLFDENEPPLGVYIINKGTVKLSKSGTYGKDQILRFIKEGDLVGYRSLLIDENFQAKAEAMTEVSAMFVPTEVFLNLLQIDPKLSFAMLQKFAYELGECSNTITFLAQKTVRERLAEVLILLEQKLGIDPEGFIKISLTREEVANLIGTATESAIRLISEFKHDELIETDGRLIRILNHEKLSKLAHIPLN